MLPNRDTDNGGRGFGSKGPLWGFKRHKKTLDQNPLPPSPNSCQSARCKLASMLTVADTDVSGLIITALCTTPCKSGRLLQCMCLSAFGQHSYRPCRPGTIRLGFAAEQDSSTHTHQVLPCMVWIICQMCSIGGCRSCNRPWSIFGILFTQQQHTEPGLSILSPCSSCLLQISTAMHGCTAAAQAAHE